MMNNGPYRQIIEDITNIRGKDKNLIFFFFATEHKVNNGQSPCYRVKLEI